MKLSRSERECLESQVLRLAMRVGHLEMRNRGVDPVRCSSTGRATAVQKPSFRLATLEPLPPVVTR